MKYLLYNNYQLYIPNRYYNQNLISRFQRHTYEKLEENLIMEYFNQDDYVLELGSGLGYITAILSNRCKHIIAIEANPELKESLSTTILNNKLNNVDLICSYISNSKKRVVFDTYDLIVAGSADRKDSAQRWKSTKKRYTIDCMRINDIPNINLVNSLVLDCEGGELIFLQENLKLLTQCKKIAIELHESMMYKGFNKKCMHILFKSGFVVQKNINNKVWFLTK